MFCKFCGREIAETANFCPGCGKAVAEAPAVAHQANEDPASAPAPVLQEVPQSAPQQAIRCPVCGNVFAGNHICPRCGWMLPVPGPGTTYADTVEGAKKAKTKKKKTGLIIGGSILGGVVFLGLLAVLAVNFVLPRMGFYGEFDDILSEAEDAYDYEEDVEKAQKLLNRAYRAAVSDRDRAQVFWDRGVIAYLEGDPEEAAEHLRKAIDMDNWTAELYLMLAACYMDAGDDDAAFDALMEGWEAYPGDDGIAYTLWDEFNYEPDVAEDGDIAPEGEAAPSELPDVLQVRLADEDPLFDLGMTLGFEMAEDLKLESEVSSESDAYSTLYALEEGDVDVLIVAYTAYDCESYGFDFIYTDPICEFGGLEYAMILRADSEALRDELDMLLRDYKESGYLEAVLEANLPDAEVA